MSSIVARNAIRRRRSYQSRLMAEGIPLVFDPAPLLAMLNRPRRLILPIVQFSDLRKGS